MPLDPSRLALFLAATLALTLTPGPAVLFLVTRTVSQGRRAGLLSLLGIGLGNCVHAGATALGLAALLASVPVAFTAVKLLGAGVLVWMGVRRLLDRSAPGLVAQPAQSGPAAGTLRQAFAVAALNPKTALFFLAFLPQFASPALGHLPFQLLLLGAIFVATAMLTDGGYVLLADGLGRFLRRHPGFARAERWVSAAVYAGLGLLAALAQRPGT